MVETACRTAGIRLADREQLRGIVTGARVARKLECGWGKSAMRKASHGWHILRNSTAVLGLQGLTYTPVWAGCGLDQSRSEPKRGSIVGGCGLQVNEKQQETILARWRPINPLNALFVPGFTAAGSFQQTCRKQMQEASDVHGRDRPRKHAST